VPHAFICDLVNNRKIITIDIKGRKDKPRHKRIKCLSGSSTPKEIIDIEN